MRGQKTELTGRSSYWWQRVCNGLQCHQRSSRYQRFYMIYALA